jgi:hypothetical protein
VIEGDAMTAMRNLTRKPHAVLLLVLLCCVLAPSVLAAEEEKDRDEVESTVGAKPEQ